MCIKRLWILFLLVATCCSLLCDNPLNPKTESIRIPASKNIQVESSSIQNMAWSPDGDHIVYELPVTAYQFNRYSLDGTYVDRIGYYVADGHLQYYDDGFEKVYYNSQAFSISDDYTNAAFIVLDQAREFDTIQFISFENQEIYMKTLSQKWSYYYPYIIWSPTSRQIATIVYANKEAFLLVLPLLGEERLIPIDRNINVEELAWSSDERSLCFQGRTAEGYSIFLLNIESGIYHEIKHSVDNEFGYIKWLYNKEKIAYFIENEEGYELHLLEYKTQQDIVITDSLHYVLHLVRSSNNNLIQFIAIFKNSYKKVLAQYQIDDDTLTIEDSYDFDDDYNIASGYYVNDFFIERTVDGDNSRLALYTISKNEIEYVTGGFFNDSSPSWSFAGNHFLFTRDSQFYCLYMLSREVLPFYPRMTGDDAEYSPDNRHIVCSGWRGEIVLYDVDSGEWTRINDDPEYSQLTEPTWSPDGNRIACRSWDGSIVIFKKYGKSSFRYEKTIDGVYKNMNWANSTGAILYMYPRSYLNSEIRAINPDTGAEYLFVEGLNNPSFCWSPDGSQIAYTQDNQIIIQDVVTNLNETGLN